jgi:hypothetical protein
MHHGPIRPNASPSSVAGPSRWVASLGRPAVPAHSRRERCVWHPTPWGGCRIGGEALRSRQILFSVVPARFSWALRWRQVLFSVVLGRFSLPSLTSARLGDRSGVRAGTICARTWAVIWSMLRGQPGRCSQPRFAPARQVRSAGGTRQTKATGLIPLEESSRSAPFRKLSVTAPRQGNNLLRGRRRLASDETHVADEAEQGFSPTPPEVVNAMVGHGSHESERVRQRPGRGP